MSLKIFLINISDVSQTLQVRNPNQRRLLNQQKGPLQPKEITIQLRNREQRGNFIQQENPFQQEKPLQQRNRIITVKIHHHPPNQQQREPQQWRR